MHIKLTNDLPEIYSIGQLRRDNPNTSFPRRVSADTLASYGVYPYTVAEQPEHDLATQVIEPGDFTETESGWVRGWTVRDKRPEELLAAYEAAASTIRQLRNQRLKETDWVVIYHTERGTNIPLEWEQYRQDLRNITDHVNFPRLTEEDWPVKPE